ncbi:Surface polysaccharide O-acyltransferase, integral membrane enzyme [Rhizobium sp. RU33A]|uniref:acyltransferase n=1 Tax=Rhizobium sp. RU33A TaxID=1907413 RepID=UPI0009550872|nr:acyltransferase family protein [Rhizobium sp. RU33A]SIR14770.1 Surface polysaccharide O-acyltransferase, integral membrane enzyme [Rhizobium sp. RU33A]
MTKHTGRLLALDFIRASAVLMVIVLHSASGALYQIQSIPPAVWAMHNGIDSAVRICVPLFFMISGYLLLEPASAREGNPLREVCRRLSKILVPLFFWSLLYQFYVTYNAGGMFDYLFILKFFKSIFQGAVVYHLWFLYEMAIVYLLVPVLRPLVRENDVPAVYFCSLWLFLSSLQFLAFVLEWNYPFSGHINLGNLGFFVAGYLVRRRLYNPRAKTLITAALCYVAAAFLTALWTSQASYSAARYVEFFHVYSTPNVAIMSISAFVLLMRIGQEIENSSFVILKQLIKSVSACSFGIYFVHVLVLERMNYNILGKAAATSYGAAVNIGLTVLVCFLVCWAIVWCLRLFKFTKWMAP